MSDYLKSVAAGVIKRFDWENYGLDEVGQTEYDDWAEALAEEVVDAVVKASAIERGGDTRAILGQP